MKNESVFLIESDSQLRMLLAFALMRTGYKVSAEASAQEGLEAVRAEKPDLILLAGPLQDMDACDACEAIRADPELGRTPLIMIVPDSSDELEEAETIRGLDSGADNCIPRSLGMPQVLMFVKNLLRRCGQEAVAQA